MEMRNGDTVRMWYDPAAQILRYEWIEPADFYKPPNPLKGHDMGMFYYWRRESMGRS